MKPVEQTEYGKGKGNCFSACVASILEIGIEDVPHFCEENKGTWFVDCAEWLTTKGYGCINIGWEEASNFFPINCWLIVCGDSWYGSKHAVIGKPNIKNYKLLTEEETVKFNYEIELVWDPDQRKPLTALGLKEIEYLIIIFETKP